MSARERRDSRTERRPSWRDDRVWQVGFLLGSALGAAATVAGRHAEKAARRGGLVDWPEVERIAIGRLRRAPGTLEPAELREHGAAVAGRLAHADDAVLAVEDHLAARRHKARRQGRNADAQIDIIAVAQLLGGARGHLVAVPGHQRPPSCGSAQR